MPLNDRTTKPTMKRAKSKKFSHDNWELLPRLLQGWDFYS